MNQHDDDPVSPLSPQRDDALTDAEAAAFAALPREIAPAPALESRVVSAVRGAVPGRTKAGSRWMLAAAAAAIFFVGYMAARAPFMDSLPLGGRVQRSRYLLLLYDTPGTATADAANSARLVAEYTDWFKNEHAAGVVESGEKLDDEERTLGPALGTAPRPAGCS